MCSQGVVERDPAIRYISSADSNQLVIMEEKENKRSGKRLTVKGCLDWDCR